MKTQGPEEAPRADAVSSGEVAWVRRFYAAFAPEYDLFRSVWSALTRDGEQELDRLFSERVRSGSRVLELAPGTGIILECLFRKAPRFGSYVGVDASEATLDRARRKARGDPRIELRVGDALDLSDIPGHFDFLVCTWMLSHLAEPGEAIRRALDKLSPGGTAVFLAFSAPRDRWLRRALRLGARVFKAHFVSPAVLRDFPELERIDSYAGGMATLGIYRRDGS